MKTAEEFLGSLDQTEPAPASADEFLQGLNVQAISTGTGNPGVVMPAIKRAAGQLVQSGGRVLEDVGHGAGLEGVEQTGQAIKGYGQGVIEANPSQINSMGDFLEHPWTGVKESVAQMGAQLPVYIAGGGGGRAIGGAVGGALAALAGPEAVPAGVVLGQQAGGWLGGMAASSVPEYGEIRDKQDETGKRDIGKAVAGALAAGAVENIGGPQRLLRKGVIDEGLKQGENRLLHAGKSALSSSLEEGGEELVQSPIEQFAGGQNPLTAASLGETALSVLMGAAGGAPIGGVHGVMARRQPEPESRGALGKAAEVARQTGAATQPVQAGENTPFAEAGTMDVQEGAQADSGQKSLVPYAKRHATRLALQKTRESGEDHVAVPHPSVAGKWTVAPWSLANQQGWINAPGDGREQAASEGAMPAGESDTWKAASNVLRERWDSWPVEKRIQKAAEYGVNPSDAAVSFDNLPEAERNLFINNLVERKRAREENSNLGQAGEAARNQQGQQPANQAPVVGKDEPTTVEAKREAKRWKPEYHVGKEQIPVRHVLDEQGNPTGTFVDRAGVLRDKAGNEIKDEASDDNIHPSLAGAADTSANQESGKIQPVGNGLPPMAEESPLPDAIAQNEARAPVEVSTQLDHAAHQAATSPANDKAEPTQAQKEAGNYAKGHINVGGLDISVENPQGSVRRGVDARGKPWQTAMLHHYGYIKGTVGKDKDHVDAFIKPGTREDYDGPVYVVDQVNDQGGFDEHKALIGFDSPEKAWNAYHDNYHADWQGAGGLSEFQTMQAFKDWVYDKEKTQKPIKKLAPKLRERLYRKYEGAFQPETNQQQAKAYAGTKDQTKQSGPAKAESQTDRSGDLRGQGQDAQGAPPSVTGSMAKGGSEPVPVPASSEVAPVEGVGKEHSEIQDEDGRPISTRVSYTDALGRRRPDIRYSKHYEPGNAPQGGLDAQRAREIVAGVAAKLPGLRMAMQVFDTQEAAGLADIPEAVEAVFDVLPSGRPLLRIVAENIRDENHLRETLREEIIGHYGLRALLSPEEHDELMRLIERAARVNPAFKKSWQELSGRDVRTGKVLNPKADYFEEGEDYDREMISDEVISKMARQGVRSGVMDRVIAIVVRALRRMGLWTRGLAQAEARQLLAKSEALLKTGNRPGDMAGGRRYSKKRNTKPMYGGENLDPFDPNAAPEFERRLKNITLADLKGKPKTFINGLRPLGLQLLGRQQLTEVYGDDLPELKHYNRLMMAYGADGNQTMQEAGELSKEWGGLEMRDSDRLSDVMHFSTVHDVDAAAKEYGKKWTEETAKADFAEEYSRLGAESQRLERLIRGTGGRVRVGADWWGDLGIIKKKMARMGKPWSERYWIKRRLKEDAARLEAWEKARGEFLRLSPKAQGIYESARDMYQKHWQAVEQALVDRIERSGWSKGDKKLIIDQLRVTHRKEVPGVYFPLHRDGDYIVVVKNADGHNEAVAFAESLGEAEKLRAEMARRYAGTGNEVMPVTKKKTRTAQDTVSGRFVGEVLDLIGESGGGMRTDAFREQVMQLYLEQLPGLSWAKHEIHRKKTPGYSRDARRAFASHMVHGAAHLARIRYLDRLEDSLDKMQEQVDEHKYEQDFDAVKAQEVVNEMRKRHELAMNPPNTPLANFMTSAGFVWCMVSPAAAIVNLTQTPMVAFPVLGARYGVRNAAKALSVASKDATQALSGGGWFKSETAILERLQKQLKPDEYQAIQRGIKEGHISVTLAHDLAGVAQGAEANPAIGKAMRAASWMFHQAEMFNRISTVLAAYRLGKAKGLDAKASYDTAVELNYKAHFDYAASNRPRVMAGPVARVILLFKQYAQNMIYLLSRNAIEGLAAAGDFMAGRPISEKRREAAKLVSGLLAMHGLMAGALGLPLATTLLAAASAIGSDDDEPWDAEVALRNWLADLFGAGPAEAIVHGLPRLARDTMPADISSRVGLDHLLLPDVQEGLEGDKWYQAFATAALGPVIGIGLNLAKGVETIAGGEVGRGLEEMLPKVLRDAMKAERYAEEGVKDKTGIQILDDTSLAEELAQAAGFSPARVMEAFEARGAVYNLDRKLTRRRQELMADWARSRIKGEDGAEELAAVKAWNQAHRLEPGLRIDKKSLRTSLLNRERRIAEAREGTYLPRKRVGERQAGRFFED